jgi:hypothetical protein
MKKKRDLIETTRTTVASVEEGNANAAIDGDRRYEATLIAENVGGVVNSRPWREFSGER